MHKLKMTKVMLLKTTKPITVHYISVEVKIHSWKLQNQSRHLFWRMRSHEIYDEWKVRELKCNTLATYADCNVAIGMMKGDANCQKVCDVYFIIFFIILQQ